MKTVKYIRKGRRIKNLDTNKTDTWQSINLAKKESRRLQQEHGRLGDGLVRVG